MTTTRLPDPILVRSTIDNTIGVFTGWDDDGAALVRWPATDDVEATFHWDRCSLAAEEWCTGCALDHSRVDCPYRPDRRGTV